MTGATAEAGDEPGGVPLERVRVENFGCLRDVEVALEPLTVLVGANDSGKSMLLRALLTVSQAMEAENGWGGVFQDAAALHARTFDGKGGAIRFQQEGRVGELSYAYEEQVDARGGVVRSRAGRFTCGALNIWRTAEGLWHLAQGKGEAVGLEEWRDPETPLIHSDRFGSKSSPTPELRRLLKQYQSALPVLHPLTSLQLYALRPEHLRASRRSEEAGAEREEAGASPWLGQFGGGLASAIAELLLNGRDVLERIEEALRRAMPQVKRVDVRRRSLSRDAESYSIELVTRSGARIPSRAISDGVLLFLGYLYLVLGPEPASILLIEEPETGIHPGLLRRLLQLFRDMTTGAHGGPPTQILLTTHSPVILGQVWPAEVRVFQRDEEGATHVTPLSEAPDVERLLDQQGPGEAWFNEDENVLARKQGAG